MLKEYWLNLGDRQTDGDVDYTIEGGSTENSDLVEKQLKTSWKRARHVSFNDIYLMYLKLYTTFWIFVGNRGHIR
jgi:hypothetical protein